VSVVRTNYTAFFGQLQQTASRFDPKTALVKIENVYTDSSLAEFSHTTKPLAM
jgi:hypothetical protein